MFSIFDESNVVYTHNREDLYFHDFTYTRTTIYTYNFIYKIFFLSKLFIQQIYCPGEWNTIKIF